MVQKRGKTVLAAGAFDLLHYGHVRYLEEAKKLGGKNARLVVVVARDKTVHARKGVKPVIPEDQRRALVEALKPVDEAILGVEEFNLERVLTYVRPDIITTGYDEEDLHHSLKKLIEEKNMNLKLYSIKKFGSKKLDSSSKIKRKVIQEWGGS